MPYPFTSRSEYERYMARPVGNDWNAAPAVKKLTRPAVSVRAGAAVEPIRKGGGRKKGLSVTWRRFFAVMACASR